MPQLGPKERRETSANGSGAQGRQAVFRQVVFTGFTQFLCSTYAVFKVAGVRCATRIINAPRVKHSVRPKVPMSGIRRRHGPTWP